MQFIDAASVDGARLTSDGYLVAEARAVRTGIQVYSGAEVGKPELATIRVYRPEAEVFASDSLASFSHVPVTDDHPTTAVNSRNWKDLAVGETGGEVLRDGHRLRIPLILKDGATIAKVQAGKRELSAGYTCDLVFETGTTAEGEAYDAVQRNIRANHLAVVQRGRAGSECRIGDGAVSWGATLLVTDSNKEGQMADTLRKVMVDGLQVETTDAGAAAIDKLTKDRDDAKKALTDAGTTHREALAAKDADIARLTAEHKTAIEKKDGELAAKDAALDAEKAKVLSDVDLDKRVTARADLISTAKAIAKDVQTTGLSDAAIRKAVVVAKLGDAAVKDKSEAYVDARFDILADAAKADPFARVVADGVRPPVDDRYASQSAYEKRLGDAWKPAA